MNTFTRSEKKPTKTWPLAFIAAALLFTGISAQAQQQITPYPPGARPFYWWGADNTVWNYRLQIQQEQQRLSVLIDRARYIRFSPAGYLEHMRQLNALRTRISKLNSQLRAYLNMHWRR